MSFILTQPLCLVPVPGVQGLLWKLQFVDTDQLRGRRLNSEREKPRKESQVLGVG